jgi:cyclopropane fatty-acyl-phospholipid synthase-like methyltransferase
VYEPRHYRKTIECWLSNFEHNASMLRSYLLEVDHSARDVGRIMRTWMFYLSAVRNMFMGGEGTHQVVQLCLERLRH